jgi:predicted XRE-type DNA-binding protein
VSNERFANVWDAIEDTPAQAENMKVRASLMLALRDHIEREGLSQSQAAKLLAVTQPRISDLMRGKIDLFAIDTLVNMLASAGLSVEMRIGAPPVQREKIARPTRRSPPRRTARRTSRPAVAPQRTKSARRTAVA